MPDLVAKAVLQVDASGMTLAAGQIVDGSAKAKAAIESLGDAGQKAAVGTGASAGASAQAAKEAEGLTRALGATGEQRKADIASLATQSAAHEAAVAKVNLLSKALTEYNSGVAASETLQKAGLISDKEHAANVEGFAASLNKAKAAASEMGAGMKDAEVDVAAVEKLLGTLGLQAGATHEQIKILREGLKAIPALASAFPLATAAGAAALAFGVLAKAESDYENSINKLNVTLQAHALAVAGTSGSYIKLASSLSDAADVSEKSGRLIAGSFADANLSPQVWVETASAARDYAALLGQDVPQAAATLAQGLSSPTEMAKKLTDQYGLFDSATLSLIQHLERSGQTETAQATIVEALSDRIKGAADQTTGWAWAYDHLGKSASNAWDAVGKALFPGDKLARLRTELASNESALAGAMSDNPNGYRDKQITWLQGRIAALNAQIDTMSGNNGADEARNHMSVAVGSIDSKYNPFDERKNSNDDELITLNRARTLGVIDEDKYQKLLKDNTREYNTILKDEADYYRSLNHEAQFWYQRIRSLVEGSKEAVAQGRLEAETAQGRSKAYREGDAALSAFNDTQEVQSAILPYLTAKYHAHGVEAEKLAVIIATLRAEKIKQLAADKELAAMQAVDQGISSASGYMSEQLQQAKLDQQLKVIEEARQKAIKNGPRDAAGDADAAYVARVEMLYAHLKNVVIDDDTKSRRDWASGIMRANKDLERSQEDLASVAETSLKNWASTAETTFEGIVTSGKLNLDTLGSYWEQVMMKMAYQRYLATSFNAVGNGILGGIDKAFGGLDSLFGGGSTVSAGQHHFGGIAGQPAFTRDIPAAYLENARRYHNGGTVLQDGEVAAVLRVGERVKTEYEQRSDVYRDAALASALQQPIILNLPKSNVAGSGANDVHIHEVPGVKFTKTTTTKADGSQRTDVVAQLLPEIEAYLADRLHDGSSALTGPLDNRYVPSSYRA